MDDLLRIHLRYAVSLAIAELRLHPGILRALRGQTDELSRAIATYGDAVLFGGEPGGMGVLSQAIAVLAFQPGGVTVAGLHWQAEMPACEPAAAGAAGRKEGAD